MTITTPVNLRFLGFKKIIDSEGKEVASTDFNPEKVWKKLFEGRLLYPDCPKCKKEMILDKIHMDRSVEPRTYGDPIFPYEEGEQKITVMFLCLPCEMSVSGLGYGFKIQNFRDVSMDRFIITSVKKVDPNAEGTN